MTLWQKSRGGKKTDEETETDEGYDKVAQVWIPTGMNFFSHFLFYCKIMWTHDSGGRDFTGLHWRITSLPCLIYSNSEYSLCGKTS